MNTFADLYDYLRHKKNASIISFLEKSWSGKDKQESLFRLFAYLGLNPDFTEYSICDGNFNKQTIKPNLNLHILLQKNLKDKGDKSDLTLMHKTHKKLIITSSKNLTRYHIGDLDIRDIILLAANYKEYSYQICIVVKNKEKFQSIVKKSESCNEDIIQACNQALIYDWSDLNAWYYNFKLNYENIPYDLLVEEKKSCLNLLFHQEYAIRRTMDIKNNHKHALWGHIPRSGKSYIMAGLILRDSEYKDICNYLLITTAPNETISQYINIFTKSIQFCDFNIINLQDKKCNINQHAKNIIIGSKQFLDKKIGKKAINWLKDVKFDIRFIDESHYGGTTELAQQMLNLYGKYAFTVHITATYLKPISTYNIVPEAQVLWTLEDINLCKNIIISENVLKIKQRHGNQYVKGLFKIFPKKLIAKEYAVYPELHLLTLGFQPDIKQEFINYVDGNEGWSLESLFMLRSEKGEILPDFIKKNDIKILLKNIFGKFYQSSESLNYNKFSKEIGILDRIENITQKYNSRWFCKETPLTILCFLPCGIEHLSIDKLSHALKALIVSGKLLPDFEVELINSTSNGGNSAKSIIQDTQTRAKNNGKKGVLILSGKQCSLGVTIPKCDIVLLMNNTKTFDTMYQMIFRCMTEAPNKRCGFVIDLNIQRSIDLLVNYADKIYSTKPLKDGIKYVLEQRLITFNADYWLKEYFELSPMNINDLTDKIYNIWMSNPVNCIHKILTNWNIKINLSKEAQHILNKTLSISNIIQKTTKKNKLTISKSNDIDISKGIEKTKSSSTSLKLEKIEKNVNFIQDVLRFIIPLVCVLTMNKKLNNFKDICDYVQSNEKAKLIVIYQIKIWWKKDIADNILDIFSNIYVNMNEEQKKSIDRIIQQIKELLKKNRYNFKKLGQLFDEILIPHELEKKLNAEVSTPFSLRQEMLGKIPSDFWTEPRKVIELSCGKGGFLIDLVEKFMLGLKTKYPNKAQRYKVIVEECLYFVDINPTNIYICKTILDPDNQYKLNFHEGDALKLDIREKWGLDGFDLVIGNPPYNMSGNTATGNTIWQKFVKFALEKCLLLGGYLIFVHPPG
jgi:hypothetical protein